MAMDIVKKAYQDFPIRRIVASVTDKPGLAEFIREIPTVETIVSSGGTEKYLRENLSDTNIEIIGVEAFTGVPEGLGGRVKTLHPKVHAAILADRLNPAHQDYLHEIGVPWQFDMAIVGLYQFEKAVAQGLPYNETTEQIDIGGPTILEGAAKNAPNIIPLHFPFHVDTAQSQLTNQGTIPLHGRLLLAGWTMKDVAKYRAANDAYMNGVPMAEKIASYDVIPFPKNR
jgi:phosphoribosylaminoimidazolecarboxamide formyltransferase / IMP cyclohydrolase